VLIFIDSLTLIKTCTSTGFTFYINFHYSVGFTQTGSCSGTYFPSISNLSGVFNCGGGFNNLSSFSSPWTTNTSGHFTGTGPTGTYTCTTPTAPACCSPNPGPISDAACTGLSVTIQGNGFARSNVALTYTPPPTNPLPIKLVTFDGKVQDNKIVLTWMTATEKNNRLFTIERSANAKEWKALYDIEGAGSSTTAHNYQYTDESPLNGTNYYRLKQTDENGDVSYSYIVSVKRFSLASDVTLYPNPARDNQLFISGLEGRGDWQISVSNATSQLLYSGSVVGDRVTLPELAPGMYFVRLSNSASEESKVFKYIKE
jgi:hypothetical protein